MFTVLSRRLRFAFLLLAVGLAVAHVAQAGAYDVCFNFLEASDYVRAETEAKALLQRNGLSRTEQRAANLCLGRTYDNMGRTRDALPAFQQVESLSQTTEELAVAYAFLGSTYNGLNDLDRAELYDQRAIKAFKEQGDKSREASILNNLARVVNKRGDAGRALTLYQEALALEPDEANKPSTLSNIALIYADRKQYDKAVKMLRQAVEIGRRNGNSHDAAMHQINLGLTLGHQGKYAPAEKELTVGYNAIRLVGDKSWEATACYNLGELASIIRKDVVAARKWKENAEAIYREIGDTASADEIANELAGK